MNKFFLISWIICSFIFGLLAHFLGFNCIVLTVLAFIFCKVIILECEMEKK